ncbi:Hpt domain-containing protein|uniref:Hpt domain-containing protein n=1 Tax=Noviherbaspirillum sp. L7-7A TaxID=2850560 RepID=UPI001C2B87D6|nr:Hpt domain-containing protein [Noviherbaspirillum sp. L7-7A]MBV0880017.1 Hpt domain-containing protein [Noviherbaspirillum sp. L7-7A]
MHAVSGDQQIYLEMCHLFLRTVPELRRTLCDAASRHDTEAVRRQAHSLRGSCLVVGALELVQLLHEAERSGIKGNVADMVARVGQAALGLDALIEEIQEALTHLSGANAPGNH